MSEQTLISYFQAIELFEKRLKNTSLSEIAMWVFSLENDRLPAYDEDGSPFLIQHRDFYSNPNSFRIAIMGLKFSLDDINLYQPQRRYITRESLISRWKNEIPDRADVLGFINKKLITFHPICGQGERGEDWDKWCLFDLDSVINLEQKRHMNCGITAQVNHDDLIKNDPNALTKLEKQHNAILEVIKMKNYDAMNIPDGEKGTIKQICEIEYSSVFSGTSSFDRAWDKGLKKHFKMANHESFARRGKQ